MHLYPFNFTMKKTLLAAFALIGLTAGFSTAQAQNPVPIYLQIIDKKSNESLPFSNTLIFNAESGIAVAGEASDSRGNMTFLLPAGKYIARTSYVGYADNRTEFVANGSADTLRILLQSSATQLNEVRLKEEATRVEQTGDTTAYNANAYRVNPDANAQNLLEKMPGVTLRNGQIEAQGERVQQVLVDGKPFFGDDPNAALKNIPAEMIQQIQVFDQQSEQSKQTGFDDGETTKTLNVVTKEEFRNGTFGNGYGGYGSDDRYQAGAAINRFKDEQRLTVLAQWNNINNQNFNEEDLAGVSSGGGGNGGRRGGGAGGNPSDFIIPQQGGITETKAFGINYTDEWGEKWKANFSYFYNEGTNANNTDLRRVYVLPGDSGQIYEEQSNRESKNINHRLNGRIEYQLSERTSLLIRPSATLQYNKGSSDTQAKTFNEDGTINASINEFDTDYQSAIFRNQFIFRHRFEKRGRSLSISSNQQWRYNDGTSYLLSDSRFFLTGIADTLDQLNNLDQNEFSWDASFRYSEPLFGKMMLQVIGERKLAYNKSDKKTFNALLPGSDYSSLDTTLSNLFDSRYIQDQIGLGLMRRDMGSFLIARVSYQWSNLASEQFFPAEGSIKKNFKALVPFVMWRYRKSKTNSLRIYYRGGTSAPSITQLQNVIDNSNPLQLSVGNPDLDQQYTHSLTARYNWSNQDKNTVTYLLASFSASDDYVANSTYFAQTDTTLSNGVLLAKGTQLNTAVNLNDQYTARLLYTYGLPLSFLRSNLNWSAGVNWSQTPGLIDEELNYTKNTAAEWGLTLSSNFSDRVDFTLSSRTSFNDVKSSLNRRLNDQYWNQNTTGRLYWRFYKSLVFRTELSHQWYTGLSDGFDTQFLLWNASIGFKFMPDDQAEFQLSVYDLLKQNQSVSRTVSDSFYEDQNTEVLQQYFMLTFRYQIKDFRSPTKG